MPTLPIARLALIAALVLSGSPVSAQEMTAPPASGTVQPAPAAPAATTPEAGAPVANPPAAPSPEAPVVSDPAGGTAPETAQGATPDADPAMAPTDAVGDDAAAAGEVPADPAMPHDLSPWGMFMAADIVVKAVMVGLAFASVVTWTVWLAKSLELTFATGRLRRALKSMLASPSLDAARATVSGNAGPASAMVQASDLELARSGNLPADGIKERVSISLTRIEAAAGRRMTKGTGLLATIGATAPFVGLFGTVWGIMNSFIGISKSQTTNLAVVAPGIAEALLATAIGLVAAIPAVVIYNHFARQVSGYRGLLGDASAETLRLLSRDLDRRDAGYTEYAQPPARLRHAAE